MELSGSELKKISNCSTYAHSSSVKGLVMSKSDAEGKTEISMFSSGYDQRFKRWRVIADLNRVII